MSGCQIWPSREVHRQFAGTFSTCRSRWSPKKQGAWLLKFECRFQKGYVDSVSRCSLLKSSNTPSSAFTQSKHQTVQTALHEWKINTKASQAQEERKQGRWWGSRCQFCFKEQLPKHAVQGQWTRAFSTYTFTVFSVLILLNSLNTWRKEIGNSHEVNWILLIWWNVVGGLIYSLY